MSFRNAFIYLYLSNCSLIMVHKKEIFLLNCFWASSLGIDYDLYQNHSSCLMLSDRLKCLFLLKEIMSVGGVSRSSRRMAQWNMKLTADWKVNIVLFKHDASYLIKTFWKEKYWSSHIDFHIVPYNLSLEYCDVSHILLVTSKLTYVGWQILQYSNSVTLKLRKLRQNHNKEIK